MSWSTVSINAAAQQIKEPLDKAPVRLVGYSHVREQLAPFMGQGKVIPNLLVTGEPGVGKTHFARWLAYKQFVKLNEHMAPLNKPLRGGIFVLLDECHLQRQPENLFRFMEQEDSTLIGATTRPEKLDSAFASRFFLRVHLEGLPPHEMQELIQHYAGTKINKKTIEVLASASAGNPRQAEQLVKTAKGLNSWDPEKILKTAQITIDGLTTLHLSYLTTLSEMERATGIATLSTLTAIDKQTLMNLERLLMKLGLVELTKTGREITDLGMRYITMIKENTE